MQVSQLIARPGEFIGREASVDGFLLVGTDSRLVAAAAAVGPEGPGVLLPHTQVEGRLLQAVPPWGGGPHIYAEDATVVGMVADGPLRFATVRALVIRRDGEVYEFADVA